LEDSLVTLGVTPVAQWSVPNGVQDYLAAELKDVPTISYDLPLEAVTSFAPDLILIPSESSVQNGIYDQLNKIAPTYVIGDKLNQDWRKSLLKIGEILNKTPEAEKAIKDYEDKAAAAKEKLKGAIGEESVAILWLVQKNFYIVDETRSSGAVLYTDLGVKLPNLVTEIPVGTRATWNPISLEKLSELTADHIILVNSDKTEGSEILDSAIWKGIPAVKAGNVHEMSSTSSWLYSGANAGGKIIDDVLTSLVK
jgi:iron complex transport system substrate-binding protein